MTSPRGGPKKVGKYEVLEVIGRGGMGVVYKAVDPEIGRLVGIKMMTSAIVNDPDLLKRFYREAQASGKLQHPNIITIYDLGVHESTPYLVMEFLEGESLDNTIKARRQLSIEEKLNIGVQVCNALAYAHERSIVHRDIKPGNVMLLRDGTVKIVDFGIARAGGDKVTRTGQVMGSVQYMSPEQINGAHVDQRTDIFSAGVLLYQLLTYVLPFEGKDTGDTLLRIIHGTPPPLAQYLQNCPAELESILLKALAKSAEERYQTATELSLDLSHVQDVLKHERVSEYLHCAEGYIAEAHWAKAQETLLQILKIDRQNVRSSMLLREVQQEIQKQQRSERAKDLRSQADQALAKGELDDALRYLGMAVDLVPTNSELLQLRDSVKQKKAMADRLTELLRRAESAHDAGDLEDALAAVNDALSLDSECTEASTLHAVITRELADRAKLKQVQNFIDEARRQISSRRFTAALEVLKKAEQLDPSATGIPELISLASTGQQQERRRKDLEQIAAEVQEALNHNDYKAACERAEKGLKKFPDDRGLIKLKALADKEREAHEKRTYIEDRISTARRLLEEHNAQEALPALEEALARYPDEFVLQTMHTLVAESIEREQTEQFKTQTIQQAKEAIRRKAYNEAIDILQAAQAQAPSTEFEDLLQFVADEAIAHEKQLVIEAAADEAHRYIAADEFQKAISLLEQTLKKVDDQELRIILSDARSQLERYNVGIEEAISGARRLQQSQRFSEAVKFMESQLPTYRGSAEFCAVLEELRVEERRLHAFSGVKERVRDSLANSNYESALAMLEGFYQQFGKSQDADLLRNEIEAKREQVATVAVEQALKDVRILLLVNSYSMALSVLDRVATDVVRVKPDLREKYTTLRNKAESLLERDRKIQEERRLRQIALAEKIADHPTIEQVERPGTPTDAQTLKASPSELEKLLGEVTLVGEHYAEDPTIRHEISDLRNKLTGQIAELRQAEIDQLTVMAPQEAFDVAHAEAATEAVAQKTEAGVNLTSLSDGRQEQEPALARTLVAESIPTEYGEIKEEATLASHEPIQELAVSGSMAVADKEVLDPAPVASDVTEIASHAKVSEDDGALEREEAPERESSEQSIHLVADSVITPRQQSEILAPTGSVNTLTMPDADTVVRPSTRQDALPPRITTSPIPAVIPEPELSSAEPAEEVSSRRPRALPAVVKSESASLESRSAPSPFFAFSGKGALTIAVVLLLALSWIGVRQLRRGETKPPKSAAVATTPPVNTKELLQKQAIADSDKRVASGDLEGAREILKKASTIDGPLTSEVNKQLAGIEAAISDEGLRKLRQREEQLWQDAQADVSAGRFTSGEKALRQIMALPEGATRRETAEAYLRDVVPKRKKEDALFAQAQRAARAADSASLQRAENLFGQVVSLDGPHKNDASQQRFEVRDRLTVLNQQREQQISALTADAQQKVKVGNISGARQTVENLNRLGSDTSALTAEIDQAEKAQQAQAAADAALQRVVQKYRAASSSNDKKTLELARSDLAATLPGAGPHAGEIQSYISDIDRHLAALNTPPVQRTSKVSKPAPPDFEGIRATVQRYAKAFEGRDADALHQIWPSMDQAMYSSYRTNFGNASSIRMDVDIKSVDVSPEQDTATVSAIVTQRYTPKGFSARNSKDTAVFRLSRRNDTWIISDVR